MNNPLLSICIPTYNRSKYLAQTLDSFVDSKGFDDRVEIIISDNCSTDDTEKVCKKYTVKYNNFKYYRQLKPTDIADKNFSDALSLGTGAYLKLSNDTLPFKFDTLEFMIDKIMQNIGAGNPLFFHSLYNTPHARETEIEVKNMDGLVSNISYGITWIAGFGSWKEQFDKLDNKDKKINVQLMQVDWTLRLFMKYNKAVICFKDMYQPIHIEKKCPYNIYEIFGQNYLDIYKEYLAKNLLSYKAYNNEKKRLLFKFFLKSIASSILNSGYSYKLDKIFYYLRDYRYDWFFYASILLFPIVLIPEFMKKILRKYFPKIFNKIKRIKNENFNSFMHL